MAGKTTISVAVVDDAAISKLNEEFLGHRGPTDVLSFVLEQGDGLLGRRGRGQRRDGPTRGAAVGWSAAEELLLYVIHGALHLAGYDDATPTQRATMRSRETKYLAGLGIRARQRRRAEASRGVSLRITRRRAQAIAPHWQNKKKEHRVTRWRHSGWPCGWRSPAWRLWRPGRWPSFAP